jgi:uncharacterized membrane protein
MKALSVQQCFSYAWQTFKARPWIFIQAGLLLFLVNMAVNLLQTLFEMGGKEAGEPVTAIVAILSAIIGIIVSLLISMGETSFFLRAHDAVSTVSLRDLWHPRPFLKFVGVSLLAGLSILIGLVLLIVPGVILGLMLMFVGYLVIEEKLGPIDAFKRSIALTKGNLWKLFLLSLAAIGLNILGFFALLIGLFVSIPVTFLMMVHAYRTLSGAKEAVPALETVAEPA